MKKLLFIGNVLLRVLHAAGPCCQRHGAYLKVHGGWLQRSRFRKNGITCPGCWGPHTASLR